MATGRTALRAALAGARRAAGIARSQILQADFRRLPTRPGTVATAAVIAGASRAASARAPASLPDQTEAVGSLVRLLLTAAAPMHW